MVEEVGYGLHDHAVVGREGGGARGLVVEGACVDEQPGVEVVLAGEGGVEGGLLDGGPVPRELGLLLAEEGEGRLGEVGVQGGIPGEGQAGGHGAAGGEHGVPEAVFGAGLVHGQLSGEDRMDFRTFWEGLFDFGADCFDGPEGGCGNVEDPLVSLDGWLDRCGL